jgi:hypothetical protein
VKYLVATVVLLLAGCGHMGEVNRAVRSYERGLAVSVVVMSEVATIGTATPAAITLSNGGPGSITGCIGPRSEFVWLTQPAAWTFSTHGAVISSMAATGVGSRRPPSFSS